MAMATIMHTAMGEHQGNTMVMHGTRAGGWGRRAGAAAAHAILAACALLAPVAHAQLGPAIGFETCPSGTPVSDIACAGVASITTAGGTPVASGFAGRFGSSGAIGLFSDSGPVTIAFAPTVSAVQVNVLAAGAGSTLEAFDAGGTSLGSVGANGATAFAAAGIATIVITDPDGEFGLDQLQSTPEGAVAGCPVYQDGCAVDVCTLPLRVGGDVVGLDAGETVTLQLNGSDDLVLGADGPFQFATILGYERSYAVSVLTQPSNETCSVVRGSGVLDDTDIDDVLIACGPLRSIGGTVSGLAAGASVTLQNNGGDDLVLSANGSFTFAGGVPDGFDYAATVLVQPTAPLQVCTVSNGSGTATADVTSIAVQCVTQSFAVGGTLSGLAPGNTVTLTNNGGDALVLGADGGFTFATPVVDFGTYNVAVLAQPTSPNQVCTVLNGSGSIAGGPATSVVVSCVTQTYTVSGTVSGLAAGNTVELLNNAGDALAVSADGGFTFATALADGSSFAVTVSVQPTDPDQTCSIAGGSGTLSGANVTNVAVTCTTQTHAVGGAVTGLAPGNSVTLTNNGGDALVVAANGGFSFTTPVADGDAYLVAVSAQPTTPNQVCTVSNAAGNIDGAPVISVAVACVTETYAIGGSVAGLAPGNSVTLTNNASDTEVVAANGVFTFDTERDDGSTYLVAVSVQPTTPDQTCSVANGAGTLAGADVTNVAVTCVTDTYTIGGSVSGLAAGNSVVLTNNGGDTLTVPANGSFTFATPLDDGETYAVAVATQPTLPNQICTVATGSGTLAGANVTSVAVTCVTQTYEVGGTVAGLAPGNTVTLTNNGGDAIVVGANGSFVFATALDDGSSYAVAVSEQPSDPDQTCVISAGSGTLAGADVTSVVVNCATDTYTVGGSVGGLAPGNSVTLTNNAGDALVVAANGSFAFAAPVDDGNAYAVAVAVQPTSPNQTCSVASGGGTVAGAAVTNVAVSCVTDTHVVGGTLNGLAAGNTATLTNNGGDAIVVGANGGFTFATAVDDGSAYAVVVSMQPTDPDQTCSVAGGSGAVNGADVTGIVVACATDTYSVGGTLSGLAAGASVTLVNNGGDALTLAANGGFTFATALADGAAYAVTVQAQPGTPSQACSVANGSGTVAGADVVSVAVTCVTDSFTIGGTLDGLAAGNSVTLTNNGGDALVLSADGAFVFATALADGADYAVTVASQPTSPAQTCVVTGDVGILAGGNVTDVDVQCQAPGFVVTPNAGVGGSIAPAAPQVVDAGETIAFQIVAGIGYDIAAVTGCGGTLTGTQYVTAAVTADCDVDASFVKRVISGPTQGGTATAAVAGDWVFAPPGNGAAQSAGFIPLAGHPKSPPATPADVEFPQGLIDIVLVQGAAGSTASVVLTFPQAIPANAQFWIYGASAGNPSPHWYVLDATFGGNTMQLLLTDGSTGDRDLAANSAIPMVGGFAVAAGVVEPPTPSQPAVIPAASTWTLFGLAVLVMLLGLACMRGTAGARD